MVVYQLLATISFGDAVSNDTLALQEIIKKMGYKTAIFAENIERIDEMIERKQKLFAEE